MSERTYLQRCELVKTAVLADRPLQSRIQQAFQHQYVLPEKSPLPPETLHLGQGISHVVYGVGKIALPRNLQDSSAERSINQETELHLALRLIRREQDIFALPRNYISPATTGALFLSEIAAYEGAFLKGITPPFFAGLVCSAPEQNGSVFLGILTEDVSAGLPSKVTPASTCSGEEFVNRIRADGTLDRIFLDPSSNHRLPNVDASLYCQERYRIDLL